MSDQSFQPQLPTPHDLMLESGLPQKVPAFPEQPEDGAVYLTPTAVPRGSEEWNQLSPAEQLAAADRKTELYKAVGNASGIALNALKARVEEAEKLAATDYLTGLSNRRAFMENLAVSVAEAAGDEDPRLDILFLDLDKFKNLNDTRGHDAGDELLVSIADKFQAIFEIREGDMIARLGGDEFVALVHNKDIGNDRRERHSEDEAIEGLANRMRAAVAEAAEAMDSSVTASVNAVKYVPGESATEFLKRADEAMYAEKRSRQSVEDNI